MKIKFLHPGCLKKAAGLTLLLPFIMSCINEDLSSCKRTLPGIKLVVAAIPGIDVINPDDVKEVDLFVFDENKNFIATEKAVMNELVYLSYPTAGKQLYVVAIANALSKQTLAVPKAGEGMDAGHIALTRESIFDGMQLYASPDDLFRGELSIDTKEAKTEPYELPLHRIVSSVSLKVKGLQEYLQAENTEFSALVGSPYNTVDFNGGLFMLTRATGSPVNTAIQGKQNTKSGMMELPVTRILSSAEGENVNICLYQGTKRIHTVSSDSEGKPLKAINGKLLEVWIDFTGQVNVSVRYSQWGKETVWKEF
ncbi:MAG: FimB/Mfa2 family fimbrial subunit [Tannerellaceae bacterium]|nr:FimB/Mfa2 family fimbrial subunit [Tannerellaceae bacterium]